MKEDLTMLLLSLCYGPSCCTNVCLVHCVAFQASESLAANPFPEICPIPEDVSRLEEQMITVSKDAHKEIESFFSDKEKSPIRVYLAPGGCGGPHLALALDEPGTEDATVEDEGILFCINKELLSRIGSASIGLTPMGFIIEPEIPFPNMGGGCCASNGGVCGSCGSGGGCH